MAAVLNSNVASLWASKNLQGAQNKMAASVERKSEKTPATTTASALTIWKKRRSACKAAVAAPPKYSGVTRH